MNTNLTYKEITEIFHSVETKYNLLYKKIDNVYFWQVSRVNIYLEIMNRIVKGNNPIKRSFNLSSIKIISYRLLINFFVRNPFLSLKKRDILVFDSGRKYKDGNKYIDIYTFYLCEDLTKQKVKFEKYETDVVYKGSFSKNSLRVKHIDFINFFSKFLGFFLKPNISKIDLDLIKDIENEFKNRINIKIDILSIVKRDIIIFKPQYSIYKLLFRVKAPKEIFITNSSDKPFIVGAAKQQKIIVNELQHGMISNYDIICNFPKIKLNSLEYFPDRFYKWENVNMCFAALPLSPNNIISFKNGHIEKWLKNTEDIKKEKKTILIISQPFGSIEILQYIERNLYQMNDYKFIYKIHPVEDQNKLNKEISQITSKYNNIEFVNEAIPIYSLLKRAEYVIGVFSSALFEAEIFQCKIILLDLVGVEMALPLLENSSNKLVRITDNLFDNLSI